MQDKFLLRVRVSEKDVHYAGGLVNGAWILGLFGDLATEICIRYDGDEGLLRAYRNVEFLAPIHAGDFIEATGRIVSTGDTSRTIELEASKVIALANVPDQQAAADVLEKPVIAAKAVAIVVTPKECQRHEQHSSE